MIKAFMKKLGGPKAVSEKMAELGENVSSNLVSVWCNRETIPYRYRLKIARIAKNEKIPMKYIPGDLKDFFIEIDAAA